MSATDQAKALTALLKKIKSTYDAPEPPGRSATEELVYAFFLWDSSTAKAEKAFDRIMRHVVDLNELRVCRPPEIIEVVGKDHPRLEERCARLRASLHEIYLREHEVSLDTAEALGKRDSRKYFESIEAMPQFVAGRILLLALGAHAIPVDDRMVAHLVNEDVFEEPIDAAKAASFLERQIKAADGLQTHLRLQMWSEDAKAATSKRKKSKTTKRKTTKSSTSKSTTKKKSTRKSG